MVHRILLILIAFCHLSLEVCDAQILTNSSGSCTMDNGCGYCCDDDNDFLNPLCTMCGSCCDSFSSCDCFTRDCWCDEVCLEERDCCKDIYQLDTCGGFATVSECTSGSVRLVGGSDPSQGILEICIFRSWEPVCASTSTDVACNSLNYSVAEGQVINMSSINGEEAYGAVCQGNESRLTECLVARDYQFCNDSSAVHHVYVKCSGLLPSSSTMVTSSALSTSTLNSSSVPLIPTDTNKPSSLSTTVQITILLVSILVTVLVVLVFVAVWLLLKKKYTSNRVAKEMRNINMDIHFLRYKENNYDAGTVFSNILLKKSQSKLLPTHLRELSDSIIGSERVKLLELIGQGEFGIVYRGLLMQEDTTPIAVAVKTLKGLFRGNDVEKILEESSRMKSFDHLNVLPLIGVSLDLGDAPCIIMPYMSEGSLLSYLKRERPRLSVAENAELNDDAINNITKQLLSICLQVANGMVYLSSQKFVHRDLAARNCLMSTDGVIKIADFGLSEDIYANNYFRHNPHVSDQVKLPIKWMALESIHDQLFNEKSDVWSYGILCWEVFSLGKTPYPGLRPGELVEFLDSGERLHQPKNAACSDEIFSLFVSCWNKVPDQRPLFEDIASSVNELLMPFADYMEFGDFFGTKLTTV